MTAMNFVAYIIGAILALAFVFGAVKLYILVDESAWSARRWHAKQARKAARR
jgi:hypothetical protein